MNAARSRHESGKHRAQYIVTVGLMLLFSIGLLGLGGVMLLRSAKPKKYTVHMLSDLVPNRRLLAGKIVEQARRHGLEIELTSQEYGALDALDLVDKPNPIDLAFVPAGVLGRSYPNVRLVTGLMREPLHLMVRPKLAEGGIAGLRGKRINMGSSSSATHWISRDVLAFAGLHVPLDDNQGDYSLMTLAPDEITAKVARLGTLSGKEREQALEELPDAVFILAPMPSLLARELVTVAGYRLVPIPFADAYCLDRISPTEAKGVHLDRAAFSVIEVPAYTYGIAPAVPEEPCRTVASRLLLIGYAPTDSVAVSRLLETVFDGGISTLIDPPALKDQVPYFPFHAGTERFMHRNDPLLTPDMAQSLSKVLGGLGAFGSGIVAFYGFLRIRQLRRFEHYYHEIRQIELIARGHEIDSTAPLDPARRRAYLEDRLLDLKSLALQDFAEGGLKGEGLMSGIISLINDTRNSLARMGSRDTMGTGPAPPS